MSYRLRYTPSARADLIRLYGFLLEHDVRAAEEAVDTIIRAVNSLRDFPFSARKIRSDDPFTRELIISFGSSGYVALYRIGENRMVTIIAVRHQREDDYH